MPESESWIESGRQATQSGDYKSAWKYAEWAVRSVRGTLDFFDIPVKTVAGKPGYPDWDELVVRLGVK